jgi:Tfp pilus assembly protein PilX
MRWDLTTGALKIRSGTSFPERGAALVIELILLLMLTLLAVSGMNSAASVHRGGQRAVPRQRLQAAEDGIEQACRSGPSARRRQSEPQRYAQRDRYLTTTTLPQLGGTPQPAMWGNSWNSRDLSFEIRHRHRAADLAAINTQGVA